MGETFEVGAEEEVFLVGPGDHNALRCFESINFMALGFKGFFITKVL